MENCGNTRWRVWVYLSKSSKRRSNFYCSTDGNEGTKWLRLCTVKFLKEFRISCKTSNNGKLKIKKVSSKAKINSLYYQKKILEPIFEEEIQTLYGKDIYKVGFHVDKVPSHTSKSTAAYLTKKESETGLKCIPFDEIRVKSPYTYPMDFFAFGLLNRALGKRNPSTPNGLWKTVQKEWSEICMIVPRKVYFYEIFELESYCQESWLSDGSKFPLKIRYLLIKIDYQNRFHKV
ncbi:uncharacterized protein TNCV_3844761 [Trichonephila clavipes]|nr:uncharacterized protein TNCV_3844761 [Trichonephila clavipes]